MSRDYNKRQIRLRGALLQQTRLTSVWLSKLSSVRGTTDLASGGSSTRCSHHLSLCTAIGRIVPGTYVCIYLLIYWKVRGRLERGAIKYLRRTISACTARGHIWYPQYNHTAQRGRLLECRASHSTCNK